MRKVCLRAVARIMGSMRGVRASREGCVVVARTKEGFVSAGRTARMPPSHFICVTRNNNIENISR